MKVRELVTTWGFDIDDSKLISVGAKLASLKIVADTVGQAFRLVAAPTRMMFDLAEATAEQTQELDRASQSLGMTTKQLHSLRFAAKMADMDAGTLSMGLRLLSRNAMNAAKGNQQAALGFYKAGVSITDASGHYKRSDQLLLDIADRFKAMPNGMEKTALAMQLFGRGGAQLIPMLNNGRAALKGWMEESEKYRTNVPDALEKTEAFEGANKRLGYWMMNLKKTIGFEVMPVLTDLIQKVLGWYEANQAIIKQDLKEFFNSLLPVLKKGLDIFLDLAKVTLDIVDNLGGMGNVMKMVAAGLAGFAVFQIVSKFGAIIEMVVMLKNAVMGLAIAEGLATGGMSLLAGAAAAAAVYGGMKWMEADMAKGSMVPTHPGAGKPGSTTNVEFKPNIQVDARGLHQSSAEATQAAVRHAMAMGENRLAAASSGPVRY